MIPPIASLLQQEAGTAAAASPDGFWAFVWSLAQQPGVIETTVAGVIVAAFFFLWWRVSALRQNARAREALADYLLGVEQAMHGDLDGARERLQRVLEQDPENHFARLMLGRVLVQLDQAEQAHQQHLYLQRAFGVDSVENDLLLAQSLCAAGLPAEAADLAERTLQRAPGQAAGWEFAYRAHLQNGDHEAAARAGRKLLALLRDRGEQQRLREDLARTVAQAGTLRWLSGAGDEAKALAREARGLGPKAGGLLLLEARLEAAQRGVDDTARQLAAPPASAGAGQLVPVAAGPRSLLAGVSGATLPMATFAGLCEEARWACRACGAPLERELGRCPRCGRREPAQLLEPRLVEGVESPTELMDRIEVNEAHVHRLVAGLESGDTRARRELLQLGDRAVQELVRAAWRGAEPAREAAEQVLRAMGPHIAKALFAAADELSQARLLAVGEGPSAVVGRIVQGFDKTALPHMEPLFASARSDHRRVLIDFFLGLGDVAAFQRVLERFPPMEILHRMNQAPAAVLRRFLQAVPRGHFLAESLLLEKTFYRDEDLLAAVPDASDPEVLVGVMRRRGPSRALTTALIAGIADEPRAAVSMHVLEEFGAEVLEHVLAAFAEPDCGDDARRRLSRVLARGGAAAAEHIADAFGPEPSAADDRLRNLLVVIGDDAVDVMVAAYEKSGWLEIVSAGLLRRHNNRRVQLAMALGELGTKAATKALKALHKREKDDNLRLSLQRAMHRAGAGDGAPEGRDG
ncbi:MAG: tetratricopeptide repeat protein [Planctomycetes bacterium]|nr:tetratricopeptide repeat protein [Planctomycetota bacterium]